VGEIADGGGPQRRRLRYPGVCATCGISLSRGAEALWDPETKQVTCVACAPDTEVAPDAAGASAAAEGERRKDKRVEDVRRRYGDHAAAVAEEMAGRDTAATWGKGSEGESKLAAFVEREVGDKVIALHDRLIPGTRGNIDHIFIAPTGVWVVDAKAYKGKVESRETGPIWRRETMVYVGGRNRTERARAVEKQVAAVIAALRTDPTLQGTNVNPALCFVGSDWGLLDFPFQVGNVWVLYPGALRKRLKKDGPLSPDVMKRIARRLDVSLPDAAPHGRMHRG
jgi:Nuclease-related domain